MGTLSLVFGIILILIGIYFVYDTLRVFVESEVMSDMIFLLLFGGILIAGGSYLISKYDDDKKKEKSENS